MHSNARAPSPTARSNTRAYPPSRVTTPTLTTMLGLPPKAPTGPLVRQEDVDEVSSTGGNVTPLRPHTLYLPAQQEEASVDVTVNDAISGPRADGPLLPVSQAAAVKPLGAGTAASADKRYRHGRGE